LIVIIDQIMKHQHLMENVLKWYEEMLPK